MLFMYQIEEKAHYINSMLEMLANYFSKTEFENFDFEYVRDEIESLLDEMSDLNDQVCISSKKFKYKFDYYSSIYLDTSKKALEEALDLLSKKEIAKDTLKILGDKINYACFIWEEKFLDDFECWMSGLTSSGLYLSHDATVYDEDNVVPAFLQMLQNALHAEKLYFSLDRNKNKATLTPIKEDLAFNRKTDGTTRPIIVHNLSGRRLITAHVAAVEEDVSNAQPEKLANSAELAAALKWHKTGKNNWNREVVIRGYLNYRSGSVKPLKINYQFQPVPKQLANIHTKGVGYYGLGKSKNGTPNILEVINNLTNQEPEKEKRIAELLLRYKRGDGNALGEAALQEMKMYLPGSIPKRRKLVEQFNRAAYLICFQEVYRRKNQGYHHNGQQISKVLELPFGMAVACVLKLIADGHLKMIDVLNANSLYGVFTGTSVMNENLLNTIEKFNALFSIFVEKYAACNYELFEFSERGDEFNVVFTPQFFHKILKETDGDAGDSDDEDYGFVEELSDELEQLQKNLVNLDLSPLKYKA